METKKGKERSTLSWVFEFAGTHRVHYVVSVVLAIASVACGFAPYICVGRIITELVRGTADMSYCMHYVLWMILFYLLNRLLHSLSTSISHYATFAVLAEIRRRLVRKLAKMPLGDVLEEASGTYKSIIIERVDSIEVTLAHMIPEVSSNAIVPFAIFIYMIHLDWRLALLSLLSLPVGMIFFGLMFQGSSGDFENTIQKTKALNDASVEYIHGIEVIKAFGKTGSSYEKFKKAAKEGSDCFVEWMRRCNVYQNMAMVLLPAQLLSLLPFAGWFYMRGWVSADVAIMLIILAMGLIMPFIILSGYMDDITKMGVIVGEATNILSKRELERPLQMKESLQGNDITLQGVRFGYREEEVLHGIDLEIKSGTVNALVGPSGMGKSTIAKLIASFWDVDAGCITYGGVDIRNIPLEEYNKHIAYVSQDNYLFDDSVMENIRLGNPAASDEDVMAAAKACGCHDFIMSLEHGYDTVCGGGGSHLSGGERQRISIARAMLKNAPVIILDEATAYTDPENEALVQRCVSKLIAGKTLIVIAHRLSTIASADNIVLVNKGVIEAQGTQEELLSNSPLYRKMWEAHIESKEGA
ncbi:MAG: ABC transporter ATP-binding protein/permease [Lachnospiraceae bacterium]|nr:ABC transporter ATP-binding protein/permease [Lachnospiraceae bacterium]